VIRRTTVTGLVVTTGPENDSVVITDSQVSQYPNQHQQDFNVGLEEGDDTLTLRSVTAGRTFLSGGPGHDRYFDEGENSLPGVQISGFEEIIAE
jgi:hypothetical protein